MTRTAVSKALELTSTDFRIRAISDSDLRTLRFSTNPARGWGEARTGSLERRKSYWSYASLDFSNPSRRIFLLATRATTSGRVPPVLILMGQPTSDLA